MDILLGHRSYAVETVTDSEWTPTPSKRLVHTYSDPLFYQGNAHGLLCAPTRAGKFRDLLAQILLTFKGSCFVIDPKGQAAAVTARYRQKVMGQKVYLLNPFNVLPDYLSDFEHARYDPVRSKLDPSLATFAADADNLFEGLMPHTDRDHHWVDSARMLGSGVAMLLRVIEKENHTLHHVYQEITGELGKHLMDELPRLMDNESDADEDSYAEYIIARLKRFTNKPNPQPENPFSKPITIDDNRELQSILSTAITHLGFLANRPIAYNMSASTVNFSKMKHEPMTVYVILPGRYIAPYATWMRTITNAWADSCLEEGRGDVPVLGVLDEFRTAVGNLNAINTINAMGTGYGCQLITVIQDLNQLKELYPNSWETFIANSGFQIFFSPRDWTTSDYISRMAGMVQATVHNKSREDVSSNPVEQRRYLPEVVRGKFQDRGMLVFMEGEKKPVEAFRQAYYENPEFEGRYDPDPYHR